MDAESLRESYRPDSVRVLLVGESAPAHGAFFYRESAMTTITARACEDALGVRFDSTEDFLRFFRDQGCYLEDLSPTPVDNLGRRERERALRESVPHLADRIRSLQPDVIVVVLQKIEKHVMKSIGLSGLVLPTYVLPFPGQGYQRVYREGLAVILRAHLRSAA